MAECQLKHTKYQPTDEEFACPKCDAKAGDFYIAEPMAEMMDDPALECTKLHIGDHLECGLCRYDVSAKSFTTTLAKKKGLKECPTCKGTGHVKA